MDVNGEWCQKIIQIGILVTIIFDAGARKKLINQRVYFEEVLKKLVQEVRVLDNRKGKATFTIIDAQSVKILI